MSQDNEPPLLVSQLWNAPVLSPTGERLGRVDDVIVRLADGIYPRITGLKVAVGKRQVFVPIDLVVDLAPGQVRLREPTVNSGMFQRRNGEVLLGEDVIDRRLIDVVHGRLLHADDLALVNAGGAWRLEGVVSGARHGLQKWLPGTHGRTSITPTIVDWSNVQPFVGHVPTAGLLMPLGPLKRLHPAQIADLVERSSHEEGEEIIEAVERDPELQADVFEELDPSHQEEFLEERSDEDTAALLARMDLDDAADLLSQLDQERRLPVLELVPAPQRQRLQALLQYHPATAGGMMSPDCVSVVRGTTLAEAIARVRESDEIPVPLQGTIFVIEDDSRFVGAVTLVDVVRGDPAETIEKVSSIGSVHVEVHADLADIALLMTDFNLTAVAVTDERDRLLGAISVDDLLEALIPEDWRRRAQAQSGD